MRRALSIDRATLFVIAVFLVLASSLGATFVMGEPAPTIPGTAVSTSEAFTTRGYWWAAGVDVTQSLEDNLSAHGLMTLAEAGRSFRAQRLYEQDGISELSFLIKQFKDARSAQQAAPVVLAYFAFTLTNDDRISDVSVTALGDQQVALHAQTADSPIKKALITVRIGQWLLYADGAGIGINPLSELLSHVQRMAGCVQDSSRSVLSRLEPCLPTYDQMPADTIEFAPRFTGSEPNVTPHPTPTPTVEMPTPTPYVQRDPSLAIQGAGNTHLEVHILAGAYDLKFDCNSDSGSVNMWFPIGGGSVEIQSGETNYWTFTEDATIVLLSIRCDAEWTFRADRTGS